MRRLWKLMERLRKWYPPGYEYGREWKGIAVMFGLGFGLSLNFFARLTRAEKELYQYVGEERVRMLRSGAVAAPFPELTGNMWVFFLPMLLFTVSMSVYHYIYYYRETKSIYLMRRLPRKSLVLKSCVRAPAASLLLEALLISLLYLLYFGVYLLVIPRAAWPPWTA